MGAEVLKTQHFSGHGGTESHTFHQGRTGRVDGGRVITFDLTTPANYNYPNYRWLISMDWLITLVLI